MELHKPYVKSVSGIITAGTVGTVVMPIDNMFIRVKNLTINSGDATITALTINGISITPSVTIDLEAKFGDLVYIENISVDADNTAGTVDATVTKTVEGIEIVRI